MAKKLKTSVGIWAFGPNATRFMPGGYHPDAAKETIEERTKRAVKGLGLLADGYEFHYPNEANEDNYKTLQKILGKSDIYCLGLGLFSNPKYKLGSFINPDKKIRKETIEITKRGIDLCKEVGARFIIWPGGEGYNYPFMSPYKDIWNYFIEGIAEVAEYCAKKNVLLYLEHKNSEPAMKILMRNTGMALFVIFKLRDLGIDTRCVKLNLDWGHLIMNGESLGEYVALAGAENLLGHLHANSAWDHFDDDNMVGALHFMETLEVAYELQEMNYGKDGERVGFDLFPYTEDPVSSVKQSILQWNFIRKLAEKIDRKKFKDAKNNRDAVSAYKEVYRVLGEKSGISFRY